MYSTRSRCSGARKTEIFYCQLLRTLRSVNQSRLKQLYTLLTTILKVVTAKIEYFRWNEMQHPRNHEQTIIVNRLVDYEFPPLGKARFRRYRRRFFQPTIHFAVFFEI